MVYIAPEEIWMVVVGFIIAFVLAIGIGANDVANTFGTSVGSKVLTLRQACIIASIVETLGAILLGSKVTDTIRKGIIDLEPYENNTALLMVGNVAALTGSCAWLIIATAFKMPVSGTHSIVGATVGFALVAHGASGVDWKQLGFIIASWFISPILSGVVSVALYLLCKFCILDKSDPLEPGLRFLPLFYASTIVVNFFSIFYKGPELLGFNRIPLWGVFILSFGSGIVTAILVQACFVPWQRGRIKLKVRHQHELEAIIAVEEQKVKKIDADNNKCGNHKEIDSGIDVNRLESIAEEEQRRSGETTPNVHQKVTIIDPNDKALKALKLSSINFAADNEVFTDGANGDIKKSLSPIFAENSHGGEDDNTIVRSRSKSLINHISTAESAEPLERKRVRSKSESTHDHMMKNEKTRQARVRNNSESRSRTYSGSIDDLHDRRFLPVDKSMALNIEKQFAEMEEKRLEEEGLPSEEIAQRTREALEDKPEQYQLFSYLQILTAVFGGFAHGGNDVSNAIGPLVSIWITATSATSEIADKASAPLWILLYGGIGISVGLWIWGRRVIETMGENLAKITPSTGFCIEIGAAFTVLAASNLGLPISTTHCKVGSVVFVGRTRSHKNVDWKLFGTIFLAWILTLPVAGGISAGVMFGLMQLI